MNSSFQAGNNKPADPVLIQGGMGIYVSSPNLAKAVSTSDPRAMGTVSCTAAERVVPHLLQIGDIGGHIKRAWEHFPFPEVVEPLYRKYFVEGGKLSDQVFKRIPAFSLSPPKELQALAVAASFALVWLAKEGHDNLISVNYLEKLQIPQIYQLTGAMLAGVNVVTMGAGLPKQIPAVLDALASGGIPEYVIDIDGGDKQKITFDPSSIFGKKFPKELKRPAFLPIVSLNLGVDSLLRVLDKSSIQGFIVELPVAGGHNAPPRVKGVFDETGQPVYGPRDEINFQKIKDLGIPFWIGGGLASPEGLAKAQALGAIGIQAGSIFALSNKSGFILKLKADLRRQGYRDELVIYTDSQASPTGYPFKIAQLSGTLSDKSLYGQRERICDRCALLRPIYLPDGKVTLVCSSEILKDFLRKGGKLEDAIGSMCLCNGLFAAVGLGNPGELPIVTMGDDVSFLRYLMKNENDSYSAADAVKYILSGI